MIAAVALAIPLAWASPAFAQRTVTVTPSSDLVELDNVTVTGAGFSPNTDVGFCEIVDDGSLSHSASDCATPIELVRTSAAGGFASQYTIRRYLLDQTPRRSVDCALESCAIAAAEESNIAGTFVISPITFAPSPPPPTTRGSITFTPVHPFDDQQLTVDGTGFRPNAKIEIRQCGTDPESIAAACFGNFTTAVSDAAGAFTAPFIVQQFISTPRGELDCGAPDVCVLVAAEVVDVDGTLATAPLDFTVIQPDGRIQRLSDGAISGDNVYNLDGASQTTVRAVAPDTTWSFAVQLQNDGDVADNIEVTAPPATGPFSVRYFLAYYDITASITGGGFTFTGVAPGQVWTFVVQYKTAADAPLGARAAPLLTFTSATLPRADAIVVGVVVRNVPRQNGVN